MFLTYLLQPILLFSTFSSLTILINFLSKIIINGIVGCSLPIILSHCKVTKIQDGIKWSKNEDVSKKLTELWEMYVQIKIPYCLRL